MSSFPVLSPRAAKTRGALLAAGLELLAERPVDAIAIDDLVAAAGVAKGSFFNHFADKRAFAQTIAEDIRREVEARVAATNQGVTDPLGRLAGGMIAAAAFALTERKRMVVLAGAGRGMIDMAHPLNDGVRRDFAAAVAAGLVSTEEADTGPLFWLGCCHTVASAVAQEQPDRAESIAILVGMLTLALRGLGVEAGRIASITQAERLHVRLGRATR